jgi:hypothetical protein
MLEKNGRRGIERVRLHADLIVLARLAQALSRTRAVPVAAESVSPAAPTRNMIFTARGDGSEKCPHRLLFYSRAA